MSDTTSEPKAELTISAQALDYAIGYLLNERVKTMLSEAKAELLDQLLDQYDATGAKSIVVRTPDGEKVSTITLTEPQDSAAVTDEDAFAAWVAENFPTEVEFKVVVRPAFEKRLLERDIEFADGQPVLKKTGEIVPGVALKKAGRPTTFSHRFDKPKASGVRTEENSRDGREKLTEYVLGTGRFDFLALTDGSETDA